MPPLVARLQIYGVSITFLQYTYVLNVQCFTEIHFISFLSSVMTSAECWGIRFIVRINAMICYVLRPFIHMCNKLMAQFGEKKMHKMLA